MAFNIIPQNAGQNWDALHDYVHAPYAHDAQRTEQMTAWFNDLYARRDTGSAELSVCKISAVEPRLGNGASYPGFHAFRLGPRNGENGSNVYFSHDPAVLTLSYVSRQTLKPGALNGLQSTGMWLNHFAVPEREYASYEIIITALMNSETVNRIGDREFVRRYDGSGNWRLFSPAAQTVFNRIETEFLRDDLPGSCANDLHSEQLHQLMQTQRFEPKHFSLWGENSWHADFEAEIEWSRSILHPLKGMGTLYRAGHRGRYISIATPPGATSSHIRYNQHAGTQHRGQYDTTGRVLLISETTGCPVRKTNPWHIEPAPLAAMKLG